MAAPTLTTMMNNVRLYIQDTDTTVSSAFTDAQLTTFINAALMWWYENNEKRVKSVTAIATLSANSFEADGDATFLYPEILGAYGVISGSNVYPLRRLGWNDVKARQNNDTIVGQPVYYAAVKYGAGAVSASSQNKWRFAFWRIPSGSWTITSIVRDYPVALSTGADICDVGDFEGKCIEIIAAILAAPRMNRPELAEDLMGLLPKLIQDKLEAHRSHDEATA
ncbi:MAG TPA: hypothetical protein VK754_00235 [Propionibacteriaceae bacterium]|nr:hypothetical protein [Propionibacteriaceae bacterium]